ncbi:MAG: hypothetical protein ACE5OZ_12205 [Candidatus Heimdallarchaeota archaeon]
MKTKKTKLTIMTPEEASRILELFRKAKDWQDIGFQVFLGAVHGHVLRYTRCIVMFVGKEGSGKTYSGISLAKELDPHFSSENIVFDVDSLLEKTVELKNQGAWILFDETGEDASARSFMSETNRVLNSVVRTNRKWGVNYILTAPLFMDVDARLRKSINYMVEIKPHKIGARSRIGLCFEQLYNPATTKAEFNRHITMRNPDDSLMHARFLNPANRWPNLIEGYEKKKDLFLSYIHRRQAADSQPEDHSLRLDNIDQIIINERSKPKPLSFRALESQTGLKKDAIRDRRNKLRDSGFALN